ncbi:MAG TPA: RodZ domain-containing protein [Alphaproteobacteria bacterium]|nr:RodZ domain-containing protein [Alphaproteobacteria bacterium]
MTVSTNPEPTPEQPKPQQVERIGDLLKRIRLERGDDLQQIADYLCIRRSFLVALENNRYDEFPADAYVIGFLRSYASFLGVDSREAIDRYRSEMAGRRKKPALMIPTPITEGRTPSALIMAGAAVAALLVYALWYGLSSSDRSTVSTPPALPSATADATGDAASQGIALSALPPESMPSGSSSPATSSTAQSTTPAQTATTAATVAPPPPVSNAPIPASIPVGAQPAGIPIAAPAPPSGLQPVDVKQVNAAPVPPPSDSDGTDANKDAPKDTSKDAAKDTSKDVAKDKDKDANKDAHLVIRAEQSTWVLITDSKGHPVYDHVMKPGETFKVPRTPNLSLTTGNGMGIILSLDGTDLPHISSGSSHVVRNIPLDDAHLKNMPSNSDD